MRRDYSEYSQEKKRGKSHELPHQKTTSPLFSIILLDLCVSGVSRFQGRLDEKTCRQSLLLIQEGFLLLSVRGGAGPDTIPGPELKAVFTDTLLQ
ncbi:Hypothetical predicted protein, partial [Xyrichtys novacula]